MIDVVLLAPAHWLFSCKPQTIGHLHILVTAFVFVLLCLLKLGLQSLLLWIGARVHITRLRATYSRTASMASAEPDLSVDEDDISVYAFEFTETEDGEGATVLPPDSHDAAEIEFDDESGSIIDIHVEVVRAISSPVPGRSSHQHSPIGSPGLFSSAYASDSNLHTPGQAWARPLSSSDVENTPAATATSSTASADDHTARPNTEPHSLAPATAERRKDLRKAVSLSSLHQPRMLPTGPLRRTITNASSKMRAMGRCERHGLEGCRPCRHRAGGNPLSLSSIVLDALSEKDGHENTGAESVYASALDLPSGESM